MANYDEDEGSFLNLGQVITTDCCATIHQACERGHVDCLRSFIDQGSNLEERHNMYHNAMTPLLTATLYGNANCVRILIDNGATKCNINVRDNNGETPMYLACESGYFDR